MSHKIAKKQRKVDRAYQAQVPWMRMWEELKAEQDAYRDNQRDIPAHEESGIW